jgi:lipopolysaccharide/colanic/teichoic acid biosynthesis glycosyltransferase
MHTLVNVPAPSAVSPPWPDELVPVLRRGWYPPARAATEFVVALVLVIVTGPAVLAAAALVRLTSRGPAFFTQTRLGRGGRSFTIYKLRSMYFDCERKTGPRWCQKRDPRITPVGQLIRRLHIDELPQLWNVVRGDMSLVGPRPERPEFLAKLEQAVPRYCERLRVRPGITGLAQVQLPPDSDLIDVRRKQAYDLYYIANQGPWLDLRILLCTPAKICGIPYHVLRWLFAMPTEATVRRAYLGARHVAAATATAVPQMQPA